MSSARTLLRLRRAVTLMLGMAVLAVLATGCGQGKISVAKPDESAAKLFNERCSGCHSLDSANSFGSKPKGKKDGGERTNGPNFNVRKEKRDDVLYAIRNGGFSGAIMPANIVTGKQADELANFLGKYSGKEQSASSSETKEKGNGP